MQDRFTERALGLPADCRTVSEILSRAGDKWSVLVVMKLSQGSQRFSELRDKIGGISQKMLTATLRGLERDGLLTRPIFPTNPPRVDYELTDLGRDLRSPSASGPCKTRIASPPPVQPSTLGFPTRALLSHRSFARKRARSASED